MKRLKFLIAVILIISTIVVYTHRALYAEKFDDLALDIQTRSKQWSSILNEFPASGKLNRAEAEALIAPYSGFIKAIEFVEEYSGVYLVTRDFFPRKEGLLLTYERITPIPADSNTGVHIEELPMASEFFAYRLCYYWD